MIYRGRAVSLRLESLVEPGGVKVRREVVCHPGSAVMVPRFPDGSVLLVRQYRHPAGQSLWELPAGTLEPNENPRHAAQRELAEETGYQARQLKLLGEFFPSPGILSEKMRLFEASGLVPSRARPDADGLGHGVGAAGGRLRSRHGAGPLAVARGHPGPGAPAGDLRG